MANSNSEFYPGKTQKKKRPALIISIVLLTLLALALLLFYGLQKYIVITNDGLHLDIPMLTGGTSRLEVNDEGQSVKVFDPVEIQLTKTDADYSNVRASAGEDLTAIKAVYIPASQFSADRVRSEAANMQYGNALVIELKPQSGHLVYNSQVDFALAYGTAGDADLASLVKEIKDGEKEIYLVAELCCLNDGIVPDRNPGVALKSGDMQNYSDGSGVGWIDPYSADYRKYITDLCRELSDMGFDEIALNGVKMPAAEGVPIVCPNTSNPDVTPVLACSGFAMSVTRSLKSLKAAVSVRLNSDTAFANGVDELSGQNAELFFKIFDRIYYYVDAANAASAVESAEQYLELGDIDMRLVPVCYGSTPETESWVFMQN